MIHHDSRPREVAESEAKAKFQAKLEEMIHSSVPRVQRVIDQVQQDVPADAIVPGKKLKFDESNGQLTVQLLRSEAPQKLFIHRNAFNQLAGKTDLKHAGSFLRDLMQRPYGVEAVAELLNEVYSNSRDNDRYLARSVRGELRGFLSDQFRRLDSRPLLDSFIKAIAHLGARPVDGFALDTTMRVRAVIPRVFEPFAGEVLAFGAELRDSDFGDGKLALSGFVIRMWCTNLATTEDVLEQVHLGKRLPDNVQFSNQTMELDTRAMASAVNDVARAVLSTRTIDNYLGLVRQANEQKVEAAQINTWVKKHLTKDEGVKLVEKYASADVEDLPPGATTWRWSNAVSWLARETEDERRKLELQDLAGKVLPAAA